MKCATVYQEKVYYSYKKVICSFAFEMNETGSTFQGFTDVCEEIF
jgi:hypothetical protein